jgi:hypothetical protein
MRLSRRKWAVLAAATVAACSAVRAQAQLAYDLRFSDGMHIKPPAAGTYTVDLWAQLTGTDTDHTNDSLISSYIVIESAGGGSASFTGATLQPTFDQAGSRPGSGGDLNGDGIGDWGSTSTSTGNTNYMIVRNNSGGQAGGGTVGQALDASGWEFKIASFTLNVTTPSSMFWNVVKPNIKSLVPPTVTYAFAKIDGTTFNITSADQHGAYTNSTGIAFGTGTASNANGTWTGDAVPGGSGVAWLDTNNWDQLQVPGAIKTATFGAGGTATNIEIDYAGPTNNGQYSEAVGKILLASDANRDINIRKSASSPPMGVLVANGVGGVSLDNQSASRTLSIDDWPQTGVHQQLILYASINVQQPGATIAIACPIEGTINKTGAGKLLLSGYPFYYKSQNNFITDINIHGGALEMANIVSGLFTAGLNLTLDSGTVASNNSAIICYSLTNNGTFNTSVSTEIVQIAGAGAINYTGPSGGILTLSYGTYSGSISGDVKLLVKGPLTLSGTASYTGGVEVQSGASVTGTSVTLRGNILNNGALTFDQPWTWTHSGVITGTGSLTKSGVGTVTTTNGISAGALTVSNGRLAISPNGTSTSVTRISTLSIAAGAALDLADNDIVVNNGNFNQIQGLVIQGFGTTTGIISSTSDGSQILALFDNALVGAGTWAGQSIGANAIVGKYTYFGDMNIDGQVSGDDYTVIDSNLNTAPAVGLGWLSGDANLDGAITGDDYTVIDANLGLGAGNPLAASRISALPEPGAAAVVLIASMGMMRKRRGR